MKKNLFYFAAAAALALTACSQDDAIVANQSVQQNAEQAVVFDTYLSNNVTRAGQTGTMNTSTLQETGFGIFAYTHAITGTGNGTPFGGTITGVLPNFMYNQYVGYEASNWVYSPLKYWPNETKSDAGTGNTATASDQEGVSFFAYAPYVAHKVAAKSILWGTSTDEKGFALVSDAQPGITGITNYNVEGDPMIEYVIANGTNYQPSKGVDLLWGVSSGFIYHPVYDNVAITQTAGLPVKNIMKPGIDEKLKFDFKHALARIGMTVVGAFDQTAQGGTLDDKTRVTIESITLSSDKFAYSGLLNLNNTTANLAKWETWRKDGGSLTGSAKSTLTITKDGEMNPFLKYMNGVAAGTFPHVEGVKSAPQNVIVGADQFVYLPYKKKGGSGDDKGEAIAAIPPYDGITTYFIKTGSGIGTYTPVNPTDGTYVEYETLSNSSDALRNYYEVNADESVLTGTTTKPNYNAAKKYVKVTSQETVTSNEDTNYKASVQYYTRTNTSGANYTFTKAVVPTKDKSDGSTKYYAITTEDLSVGYKSAVYYTVNTDPGYFMVIPTTMDRTTDATVTVTITYYVTTADDQLKSKTSEVKNVISQDVTLPNFTNGKSYNLKLVLGLTSVKVDAEVTNWEVETVESDLPKNLE